MAVGGGYVQLQHVLTRKFLRLVPPPDPIEWVLQVVDNPERFGKQTWFALKPVAHSLLLAGGGVADVRVRVHPSATGAYINYRGGDFVRGHGNTPPHRGLRQT